MGSFKTSEGERLQKSLIKKLTDNAKDAFKKRCIEDGKAYCWSCGRSDRKLSASHIISVNQCQNDGRTEYAWMLDNLQLECIELCHGQTEVRNIFHHANYRYKKEFIEKYNESKV